MTFAAFRPLRLLAVTSLLFVSMRSSQAQQGGAIYKDPSAPVAARVDDLIKRMTLEEKVAQMQNTATAIPRLDVPAYQWWNEGLHGLARLGNATLFPQAVGLAATWDTPLIGQMAETISTEARAKNADARRRGDPDVVAYGLDLWSPNINIFRDPRWGRGQETYGEDPYLTARMGVAFVRGLQGNDPKYLKTIATPKHFAVHSGPERTRHSANVDVSPHDLEDTYLPAFRATVTEAKAGSIMCAYNRVDGTPACANSMLLQQTLRQNWGFEGYVTTDCGAVYDMVHGHKLYPTFEPASVVSLRAGTDTTCGDEFASLVDAVHHGAITEAELDPALKRLFTARFRLGLFDPPADVAYAQTPTAELNSAAHHAQALRVAEESMVLLKNDGLLPLKSGVKKIAVIGPNAAMLASLEGNYNAIPVSPVTALAGMEARFGADHIVYAQGSPHVAELPIPVPRQLLHPATGESRNGLKAEYFASPDFTGAPVLTRVDPQIDFDWNAAPPVSGLTARNFGVRWTGTITAPAPGDYTFAFRTAHCYPCASKKPGSDDPGSEKIRVTLDGTLFPVLALDSPENKARMREAFHAHLVDGKPHTLKIEYSHRGQLPNGGISLQWLAPVELERAQAVAAAKSADVVVAFVGLSPDLEGEELPLHIEGFDGGDRSALEIPVVQQQMLEAVAATGKPLVVVLMNGSAVSAPWAKDHANAILEAWYPGEDGGTAIARTLTGENNPAGRLPVTVYRTAGDLPPFDDYNMKGRTYRYFTGEPLWPFGYGLSYATFRWSDVKLSATTLAAGAPLTVTATVENTGAVSGDAVSELYLTPPQIPGAPIRSLQGFSRLPLAPHERKQVTFTLDARQLSTVNLKGERTVQPGQYRISVGGNQPSAAELGMAPTFTITGTSSLPR